MTKLTDNSENSADKKINKSNIIIMTDSNSGILQQEAKDLGVYVLPMPFTIEGEEFFEEVSISQEEFYEKLKKNVDVKTSQPAQAYLEEVWDNLLKTYDKIIYLPMSSGLSGTCENSKVYAKNYNGKVLVVDNKRISVNLKESVYEALALLNQGKSAEEIKNYLEETSSYSSVYITMGVLKYLKKGGRISPAAAALGALLNFKPILSSRGGAFEKYAVVMSMAHAKKKMIAKVKEDLETKFKEEYEKGNMVVSVAHTQNEEEALKFKEEVLKAIPNVEFRFVDPLSLSVSCHIGPGALAISLSINKFLNN